MISCPAPGSVSGATTGVANNVMAPAGTTGQGGAITKDTVTTNTVTTNTEVINTNNAGTNSNTVINGNAVMPSIPNTIAATS